ncbi:MAG: J domain-containing protein [Armatimonadetes bacterium]|nr:J domain-containing protein [Armatimonadota bacterium]
MSLLRRLALVFRSYLATTQERIDSIATDEQAREADARRKAVEEINSWEGAGELSRHKMAAAPRTTDAVQQARLAADYRLLGLSPGADLAAVEEAWRRLASRADPKRFPAGSDEEKRAAEILKSINEAYGRIREVLNPIEGRFGKLEL